jgi:hypothetical protein
MGNTDVNMSGVEPEKPPLPYGVLYPPPLPDKIWVMRDGQRHEIDPDWSKHAKYYGARDDLWGDGFETRFSIHKGPSLKGHNHAGNHPDDWDVQYRLGNPSDESCVDVIAKWGLQVLDKAGFINLQLGVSDSMLDLKGRYFSKRPEMWKGNVPHPVLRQDMWNGISDTEYWILYPVMLLASALLDDPTTMCLFHALATPSCNVYFHDPLIGLCRRLQVPESLTEAEQAATFQKMCDMRQYTHFYWEDPDILHKLGAIAWTVPIPASASHPYVSQLAVQLDTVIDSTYRLTRQSKIGLSPVYREALTKWTTKGSNDSYQESFKRILQAARVPASHIPEGFEDNLDLAPLRTRVLLAETIVHEFAHAFAWAYFTRLDAGSSPIEPWVGDSRDNEFGHAAILHILGGIPRSNCIFPPEGTSSLVIAELQALAPFGIHTADKWDQWANPGDAKKKHLQIGVENDFKSPIVSFPLLARQLFDYFTKEMWETKVPRYGLDALKFVKIPEWATSRMPGPDPSDPLYLSTVR